MEYKRFGNKIIVRIDKDEEILEQVKKLALKENIRLAAVQALGATNSFTVGVYNVVEKQISAIEGLDRAKEAVKGLKSASGFIRRELGHRLHLRHVPELIFHATDSIEYSANISRILNSLDIKEDEEENDESV